MFVHFFRKSPTLISGLRVSFNAVRCLNYIPIASENKITVGHKMTRFIEKNRQKALLTSLEKKRNLQKARSAQHLLISSSSPVFNHYVGQTYKQFTTKNLASHSWESRSSSGKFFTINALGSHPSLSSSDHKFSDLNIDNQLVQVLQNKFNIDRPTNIQCLAMNQIRARNSHNLIVAETGGGKTLAYLLPIIETCHQVKTLMPSRGADQPIAVVLVPTRELAFQVYSTLQLVLAENPHRINAAVDLNRDWINSKRDVSNIEISSFNDLVIDGKLTDVLITTPARLEKRLQSEQSTLNSVYLKHIVMDEADTLMDDSFNETTLNCLSRLELNLSLPRSAGMDDMEQNKQSSLDSLKDPSTQLVFVSATVPRDLQNILENLVDCTAENFSVLNTKSTSRLMCHVPQKFLRLSTEKRNNHMLELVKRELDNKHQKRTIMIFSHRTSTAIFASKLLAENGVSCGLLTKNTKNREKLVQDFFDGKVQVLCCTDLASRGWDTLHVNHVINFEMPQFISDYIHRIGRVGRLNSAKKGGSAGIVTNYVTKAYEVDLVWNIERSVRLGVDLHNVNANAKRVFNTKYIPRDKTLVRPIKVNKLKKLSDNQIDELAADQTEMYDDEVDDEVFDERHIASSKRQIE